MNSWVASESTSSANTSCAMTKSFSDALQSNTLNIKNANPKQILRHMPNRIRPRRRIGNYHVSGTIQKPSKKINSNRSINREEQRREVSEILRFYFPSSDVPSFIKLGVNTLCLLYTN